MARKPINLELVGGKSQRQRIWDLIRKQGGKPFAQKEVSPGGIPDDTVRDFLRNLKSAGIVSMVVQGKPPRAINIWKLERDAGAEAPRVSKDGAVVTQGQGNEAIWGAMQAIGSFTPRVLAGMAGVKENTVKSYCLALKNAGYLTVERESKTGGRGGIQAQYRLLKSKVHGPRPPMITKLKAVYDPNINEVVWMSSAEDALEEAERV